MTSSPIYLSDTVFCITVQSKDAWSLITYSNNIYSVHTGSQHIELYAGNNVMQSRLNNGEQNIYECFTSDEIVFK